MTLSVKASLSSLFRLGLVDFRVPPERRGFAIAVSGFSSARHKVVASFTEIDARGHFFLSY
jgi:hypothetical protein